MVQVADHLVQFLLTSKSNKMTKKNNSYFKRDYKCFNEQNFLDDLSKQEWNTSQDTNKMYNDFIAKLTEITNKHAPIKKMNRKEVQHKHKPWITPLIHKKINHRNRLFARKKNNPLNSYLKMAYNRFRNSVNRDIKQSKKDYYCALFQNCQNDAKKIWKSIREVTSSNKTANKISHLCDNHKSIDDPKEITNTFVNYFTNVGPNLDKEIPKVPNISPLKYLKVRENSNFVIAPKSNNEVMSIIKLLDDSKSTGPSSIPPKLLKIAAPIITPHLVEIINCSFKTVVFPDAVKIAKMIPIFKRQVQSLKLTTTDLSLYYLYFVR